MKCLLFILRLPIQRYFSGQKYWRHWSVTHRRNMPPYKNESNLDIPASSGPPAADFVAKNKTHDKTVIFEVMSSAFLRKSVTIDSQEKLVEFRSHPDFPEFQGKIAIKFPPLSVLGEEEIFFEILPPTMIIDAQRNINVESILVTPILHLDRENGSKFLNKVEITLPLIADKALRNDIDRKCLRLESDLTLLDGQVRMERAKFSPQYVYYNKVRRSLKAFCFTGDSSLDFETSGVYLIVQQTAPNKVIIDLKNFSSWQEHRDFRMDELTKYFLVVNPVIAKPEDNHKKCSVHFSKYFFENFVINQ